MLEMTVEVLFGSSTRGETLPIISSTWILWYHLEYEYEHDMEAAGMMEGLCKVYSVMIISTVYGQKRNIMEWKSRWIDFATREDWLLGRGSSFCRTDLADPCR